MWLYANILQIYMYMTLIGESILINAHFILTSAHALCLSCALSPLSCRENVTDGFYAEGDSGIAVGKSLRRSLCHVHAAEERIQFISKYLH